MTDVQLTPIGTSPAWYNPGGEPASGFLLEADGARVLIDCGTGVVARYLELFGPDQPIDAIVLSHVHADHMLDLVPLAYGITIGPLGHWKPQLWLPPGAETRLEHFFRTWDDTPAFLEDAFDVHQFTPDAQFTVGPFAARSVEVPHYIECFALRFEHGASGSSFGYTADLGPCEQIVPFMRDVDLLLAEAACSEGIDTDAPGRGHITATEAGQIAAGANVGSLLLTHIPAENGKVTAREAAAAVFDGPVDLARGGEAYVVTPRLTAKSG